MIVKQPMSDKPKPLGCTRYRAMTRTEQMSNRPALSLILAMAAPNAVAFLVQGTSDCLLRRCAADRFIAHFEDMKKPKLIPAITALAADSQKT